MRKGEDPRTGRPIDWQLCSCTSYCSYKNRFPTKYDLIHRNKKKRKLSPLYTERFKDGDYVIAEHAGKERYASLASIDPEKRTGRFVETIDSDNWYHVPSWRGHFEVPPWICIKPLDVSFTTHADLV